MAAHVQQIFLAIIGVGGVGRAVVNQLGPIQARLAAHTSRKDLRLIFAGRSSKQLRDDSFQGLNLSTVVADLDARGSQLQSLSDTISFLTRAPGRVVLIDNTSDPALAQEYPAFLSKGISIVTPNKKAFSDTQEVWDRIFSVAANGRGPPENGLVFHEATVGAGLPVLSTLRELVETGDRVTKIEGIFSGTMSFLFNSFMPVGAPGGSFSAAVINAQKLGYTEPDARDDLNGLDVARKLVILARIAGLDVASTAAFPVQSLIPKELESCSSGDEFLRELPRFDAQMDAIREDAAKKGKVVRFVGTIDCATKAIRVGIQEFEPSHPIAALKGSDNIISFSTERYSNTPLTIQGAGAGADVTAMGVTGDLLKLIRSLS